MMLTIWTTRTTSNGVCASTSLAPKIIPTHGGSATPPNKWFLGLPRVRTQTRHTHRHRRTHTNTDTHADTDTHTDIDTQADTDTYTDHGTSVTIGRMLCTAMRLNDIAQGTHTHTHTFIGPFSGTTLVSQYQKGKINLDFTEVRQ